MRRLGSPRAPRTTIGIHWDRKEWDLNAIQETKPTLFRPSHRFNLLRGGTAPICVVCGKMEDYYVHHPVVLGDEAELYCYPHRGAFFHGYSEMASLFCWVVVCECRFITASKTEVDIQRNFRAHQRRVGKGRAEEIPL